jgi:hypothetical protein
MQKYLLFHSPGPAHYQLLKISNQERKSGDRKENMEITMSERDDDIIVTQSSHCFPPPPLSTLLISLKIFLRNKQTFFSIYALATLPLSFLLFSLSLLAHGVKSHVYHLEAMALHSPTGFEARHVWKESRADALSVLKLKAFFFIPNFLLSLVAAVTAVSSTVSACQAQRPTFLSSLNAVKLTWKRPSVTTIFVYAISLLYAQLPRTLAALTGSPGPELLVLLIGLVFEIYLMAVLNLGLVVSIAEDKFGWEAIRNGSGLMAGSRISGWVFSGLFVLVSGEIAMDQEKIMDGQDFSLESSKSTVMKGVAIGVKNKLGLIFLYGVVMLWSYIVNTVFYCECRKRHVVRGVAECVVTV